MLPLRRLALKTPGFSSSAWRRDCAAPTGRDGPSPAITRGTCSTPPCWNSASPAAATTAAPTTDWNCAIVNAVRCVPPQNKPTPLEITTCRRYLAGALAALENLRAIVVLGRIAHESALRALGRRLAQFPFSHGAVHELPGGGPLLFDSYHCSRYNTNTGVLTPPMFRAVF